MQQQMQQMEEGQKQHEKIVEQRSDSEEAVLIDRFVSFAETSRRSNIRRQVARLMILRILQVIRPNGLKAVTDRLPPPPSQQLREHG